MAHVSHKSAAEYLEGLGDAGTDRRRYGELHVSEAGLEFKARDGLPPLWIALAQIRDVREEQVETRPPHQVRRLVLEVTIGTAVSELRFDFRRSGNSLMGFPDRAIRRALASQTFVTAASSEPSSEGATAVSSLPPALGLATVAALLFAAMLIAAWPRYDGNDTADGYADRIRATVVPISAAEQARRDAELQRLPSMPPSANSSRASAYAGAPGRPSFRSLPDVCRVIIADRSHSQSDWARWTLCSVQAGASLGDARTYYDIQGDAFYLETKQSWSTRP